ncbi:potassium-transporting ATPase subunit KdpC [Sinomicrobium weinanense]|uniref:Potassium-transporting ATPase KdpC subunit n=1 Tax=Sinomicrobium weinanense TaxID=2842200 RepID=A0A926JWJ5_9FLAO|nr:potassium-transporting ATPase subunit KdpC [Sinomicrobium weinanense]MBC9798644.1 potassium-transporting ATPase subunit KdpC [Sinomicrobium weinanense]MBU3122361.1 potassium-transporting ATPase subunit KdpC [Sinomicrobium weinanense]
MKTLRTILGLTLLTLLLFGIGYPLAMVGLGTVLAPDSAQGNPIYKREKLVGFENIGQQFHSNRYFWSRPSAVDYDASSTGGSNYGPTNPEYLELVRTRIDTLLKYHPGLTKKDIPVDLVTASGSGLDPHISKEAALIQINRIAGIRKVPEDKLKELVEKHTEKPLSGIAGPGNYVNVLKINMALDELSTKK